MMVLFASRTGFMQTCLLVVLLVLSLITNAASSDEIKNPGSQRENNQQADQQIIPPPPPGPYISSALSDYSVSAPLTGSAPKVHQQPASSRYGNAYAPMEMFSPDIPWPENLRQSPPNRRMPETGYRTHPPQAQQRSYPVPPYGASVNRYQPYNSGMNMNGYRWTPTTGFAPQVPHQWPAINNYGMRPPAYPYPQYNVPRYPGQGR